MPPWAFRILAPLRRGRRRAALGIGLLLAVSGCGGSSGGPSRTTGTVASTSTVDGAEGLNAPANATVVTLDSPALTDGRLPSAYTCDGRNVSPPLHWGKLPGGLRELVLFALADERPAGQTVYHTVLWALAGLSATRHDLAAGERPRGAFTLEAADGSRRYDLCPEHGQSARYTFVLFALPPRYLTGGSISGSQLLRNLTRPEPQFSSPIRGELAVTYTRR